MKELKNKERKLKWHSIYGQILNEKRLKEAWQKVKANKGAGGIDGETLESFGKQSEKKLEKMLDKLKEKEYKPSPVRRQYIPKKNGKVRPLGIPTIEDRIIQQAVVNVIQPKFEAEVFHKWSCGYRPGRGVQRALQIILWHIETGYNYVYDCDIKGFFDNIPHKKLMKILNKYVADGTVLDMIWKWLKAGYMEEGKYYDVSSGTPQGGVISPILANTYLNELDWVLEENKIRFVRYADDFLVFAKSEEDIKKAIQIVKGKLEELGLEISKEKTKVVDFNDDDFDFLGYTFEHWRNRKRDGKPYFIAKPQESTWKKFKESIKAKTGKNLTLNIKSWLERVNPVIRGKINYYLNLYKAINANESYGQKSNCYINVFSNKLLAIDGYIRRRLRVAMIHDHPSQKKGWKMTSKWNNEYFAKVGLIPAFWLYYNYQFGYTIDDYIRYMKEKYRKNQKRKVERAREKGQNYYTTEKVRKIKCTQRLAKI
ncbi:group II intron reverse transcriptase/maturase [Halanaerobium saccharolyticum]|uniref:Group II intron reverse transcriptase/maturase n=1 Tax=Halanaerobium saccharolyticum TaxID=43595 RepID=A0A2T5RK60_9FIRM|nr:group II intron reverse transcriptase/maturase [Halanaerobium saccharolyticum]PTV99289.1 group II intron reverse transcriptase/maturase [Halanaerobium saccharolyticum]